MQLKATRLIVTSAGRTQATSYGPNSVSVSSPENTLGWSLETVGSSTSFKDTSLPPTTSYLTLAARANLPDRDGPVVLICSMMFPHAVGASAMYQQTEGDQSSQKDTQKPAQQEERDIGHSAWSSTAASITPSTIGILHTSRNPVCIEIWNVGYVGVVAEIPIGTGKRDTGKHGSSLTLEIKFLSHCKIIGAGVGMAGFHECRQRNRLGRAVAQDRDAGHGKPVPINGDQCQGGNQRAADEIDSLGLNQCQAASQRLGIEPIVVTESWAVLADPDDKPKRRNQDQRCCHHGVVVRLFRRMCFGVVGRIVVDVPPDFHE
ncbi:hypothetical protein PG999_001015 [Apiospora kogelbergensis]|uniref:Uncharacterized protein n=1 Tax=Apiospora kogelbergensis TaxID=1337665 RepID=A0AAW0RD34_9PEZI